MLTFETTLALRVGRSSGLKMEGSVFDPFFEYGVGSAFGMGEGEDLKCQ